MSIIHKTLPITTDQGLHFDPQKAIDLGQALNKQYVENTPFQHIVIDDFLPEALIETLHHQFPKEETGNEVHYEKGYKGLHKRQVNPNACEPYIRQTFAFFNSAPMITFFEKLTGIEGLIPDPYFAGGGFHETSAGGLLGVHADFRINKKLHVERRINAIIYLNKDWEAHYGGYLELWDKKMKRCEKKVLPIFNRCVIFNTDHDSNHGHPEPLTTPDGVTRKSIALYYYTASHKVYEDNVEHRTHYKPRPKDKWIGKIKRYFRT